MVDLRRGRDRSNISELVDWAGISLPCESRRGDNLTHSIRVDCSVCCRHILLID